MSCHCVKKKNSHSEAKFQWLKRTSEHTRMAPYNTIYIHFCFNDSRTAHEYFIDLIIFHLDSKQQSLCHLHTTLTFISSQCELRSVGWLMSTTTPFSHHTELKIDFSMCEIFIYFDRINGLRYSFPTLVKRIFRITKRKPNTEN